MSYLLKSRAFVLKNIQNRLKAMDSEYTKKSEPPPYLPKPYPKTTLFIYQARESSLVSAEFLTAQFLQKPTCTHTQDTCRQINKFVRPNIGSSSRLQPILDRLLDRLQVPYFVMLKLSCHKVDIIFLQSWKMRFFVSPTGLVLKI